jgi:hypothetical protein
MVAALEHMTQRGFISRQNGSWKLKVPLEEIDLEVPESLKTMIEAQIERLGAEEQRTLEVASVVFRLRRASTPSLRLWTRSSLKTFATSCCAGNTWCAATGNAQPRFRWPGLLL